MVAWQWSAALKPAALLAIVVMILNPNRHCLPVFPSHLLSIIPETSFIVGIQHDCRGTIPVRRGFRRNVVFLRAKNDVGTIFPMATIACHNLRGAAWRRRAEATIVPQCICAQG